MEMEREGQEMRDRKFRICGASTSLLFWSLGEVQVKEISTGIQP